jgi:methylated-DNA-[protein]-cysteine S-methyltransferase
VLCLPDDGPVVAAGYVSSEELGEALLRRQGVPRSPGFVIHERGVLPWLATAFEAYNSGDLLALQSLEVLQEGTEFQNACWEAMRGLPAVTSYREMAELAGNPAAARAVGQVCARNLVAVIVPCHRVIRGNGRLGTYAYGVAIKEALLRAEGTWPQEEEPRRARGQSPSPAAKPLRQA